MNFKSENIQSIYDFLKQDADVTNFKRDLTELAKYKKCDLHDLEAEVFQYHDLMKEDLSNKVTFVFREDGYLGMFNSPIVTKIGVDDYENLKTGDMVSAFVLDPRGMPKFTFATIWEDDKNDWIYIIQNIYHSSDPENGDEWRKYGNRALSILNSNYSYKRNQHTWDDLRKYTPLSLPYIVYKEEEIKELKETMHFALVISL